MLSLSQVSHMVNKSALTLHTGSTKSCSWVIIQRPRIQIVHGQLLITGIQTNTIRCYKLFSSSRRSRALGNLRRHAEVPNGIPTTRMIFKSQREFRERQCDFALAKTNPYASATEIVQEFNSKDYQTTRQSTTLTDFSVVA